MRTAKEIMETAFKEALKIIDNAVDQRGIDQGGRYIAASNLAIAIFSYEAEQESMTDSHQQIDEDDDQEGLDIPNV